jgi:hypothetical protein
MPCNAGKTLFDCFDQEPARRAICEKKFKKRSLLQPLHWQCITSMQVKLAAATPQVEPSRISGDKAINYHL